MHGWRILRKNCRPIRRAVWHLPVRQTGRARCGIRRKEKEQQLYFSDFSENLLYRYPERFGTVPKDLLLWIEDDMVRRMRSGCCMFDRAKTCTHCFECIGLINQKSAAELNAFEASRLLDYKLYQLNLDDFSKKMNRNFRRNGGQEEIRYSMNRNVEQMLSVTVAETYNEGQNLTRPVSRMAKGMRSVYMLSLLETYAEGNSRNPGIILVEEPEIFLHPQMQKVAGEILYRLSRKNQVMFTTHSANLLSDFNTRQIRQMVLDSEGCSRIMERTDDQSDSDNVGLYGVRPYECRFCVYCRGKAG